MVRKVRDVVKSNVSDINSVEEKSRLKKDIKLILNHLFDVSGKRGYKKFLFFLIMIDLAWFTSVALDNLFDMKLQDYGEFAWIFLFSLGLIIISDLNKVFGIKVNGFTSDNFSSLITFLIGLMALFVAIVSLPQINWESPVMSSIKGILAIIAITYVLLEAMFVKE